MPASIEEEVIRALNVLALTQADRIPFGDALNPTLRHMTAAYIAAEAHLPRKYVLEVMSYHGWDTKEKRAAVSEEINRVRLIER